MLRYLVALVLAAAAGSVLADAGVPVAAGESAAEAGSTGGGGAGRSAEEQAELARLLAIATQARAPARDYSADLDISGHPSIGSVDAPVVLIEFGSYQCGFCRRHFERTMPAIRRAYVDSGRLRYVFFDLALDPRHAHAARAAEAAHCANEQGRFWAYRGQLFGSDRLAGESLAVHAENAGLDMVEFNRCLESGRHSDRPENDRTLSRSLRVRGTPSFFLGPAESDGERVKIVRRIGGARPFALFAEQIETVPTRVAEGAASAVSAAAPVGERP